MQQGTEKKRGDNQECKKKGGVNQQPPACSQARLIPEKIAAKFA
jgi:hypothetical protein